MNDSPLQLSLALPALEPRSVPEKTGTSYPEPFRAAVERRGWRPLGPALGLKNFGVNLVRLPAGCTSSQRHWHTHEDEFLYVIAGEVTLVTNSGPQVLKAGACAGFPAGKADGHHVINHSATEATLLVVGDDRDGEDACDYPDLDMVGRFVEGKWRYLHRDGTPY
jgi:uncharacterized cupin superfamily protein